MCRRVRSPRSHTHTTLTYSLRCPRLLQEAGAYEFADTEKFLKAGEELVGDYVWGQYDILLLPPSFPCTLSLLFLSNNFCVGVAPIRYATIRFVIFFFFFYKNNNQTIADGGMENTTLTFVTPTLIAGDRSLANVVAHEIAHSWSGNLVSAVARECGVWRAVRRQHVALVTSTHVAVLRTGYEPHMGTFLAQRRLHGVHRARHHRAHLWRA